MMKNWAYLILFAAIILPLYSQSFDNRLIFDDATALRDFASFAWRFNDPLSFFWALATKFDRHLSYLSFSWIDAFTLDLFYQRLCNVCLHILNSWLLFIFLRKLFKNREAALFTAFFFAVNPAAIHAVCYLVQRNILMVVFFGLIQSILFLMSLEEKSRGKAAVLFVLSAISFMAAKFSKEQGIAFASIYPLLTLLRFSKRALLYNIIFFMPALATAGWKAATVFENGVVDSFENTKEILKACSIPSDGLMAKSITTQMRLFPKYFSLWLVPIHTSIDVREPLYYSLRQTVPFLSICLAGILFLIKNKTRILGIGILMSACFFLPEFLLSRVGEIFVVYRSYLYAVGFMVVIAYFFDRFFPLGNSGGVIRSLPFLALIPMMISASSQMKIFDKQSTLWLNAAHHLNPEATCQATRIYDSVGVAFLSELDTTSDPLANLLQSIKWFKKSLEIHPHVSLTNLGIAYQFLGADREAEQSFTRTIATDNDIDRIVSAHFGLLNLSMKKGEYEKAVQHYRKMIELRPSSVAGQRAREMLKLPPPS